MTSLREELARCPEADLVLSDRRALTRAEALHAAESLGRDLRQRGRRCLLQSADPADLLVALVACQESGADLVLAHANLDGRHVERLRESLRVDTTLAREDGRLTCTTAWEPSCPGRGSIFLMTSGTTGLPKVVEHQFERLVGRITPAARLEENRRGRWLLTYQVTAYAGLQVLLTGCLTDGTLVEPAERTPSAFAAAAERHRCTHISGTPTFWRAFLLACEPQRLRALRQITLGGEAIDQPTLDRLARAFPGARLTQIYASSEGGTLLSVHDGRAGFPAEWLGREVQGVRLRIRAGQLEVHSPRRMVGYHAEGHADPTTPDGWLATGDLVRVEGDRVVFLGRQDSLINVGGAKVYPQEVEGFLLGLPGIVEARVRPVRSPITGQAVLAEVVLAPGLDPEATRLATLTACRQGLPRQQVPAVVQVVEGLGLSESGKKLGGLREQMRDRDGGQPGSGVSAG